MGLRGPFRRSPACALRLPHRHLRLCFRSAPRGARTPVSGLRMRSHPRPGEVKPEIRDQAPGLLPSRPFVFLTCNSPCHAEGRLPTDTPW